MVLWVVLEYQSFLYPAHDVANSNTVRRKLVIAMFGDPDVPSLDQIENLSPCILHDVILQCRKVIINEVPWRAGTPRNKDPAGRWPALRWEYVGLRLTDRKESFVNQGEMEIGFRKLLNFGTLKFYCLEIIWRNSYPCGIPFVEDLRGSNSFGRDSHDGRLGSHDVHIQLQDPSVVPNPAIRFPIYSQAAFRAVEFRDASLVQDHLPEENFGLKI